MRNLCIVSDPIRSQRKEMDLAQQSDGRRRYTGLLYHMALSPRQRAREGKHCMSKGKELMQEEMAEK